MSTGGCSHEHIARRAIVQRLVRTLVVVERKPRTNAATRLSDRTIRFDEHLLVFQAAPQPFDEDVVQEPPLAVHADPYPARFQLTQKSRAGELHALIGVEYLRLAISVRR